MSGYGFPKSGSQGAVMSYDVSNSSNKGYDTVSASWSCVGAYHNDPIVLWCFNKLVERFNPLMKDGLREEAYIKVGSGDDIRGDIASLADVASFQYHGYPRINLRTLEFEVWIPRNIYNYLKEGAITNEILIAIKNKRDSDFITAVNGLTAFERSTIFA